MGIGSVNYGRGGIVRGAGWDNLQANRQAMGDIMAAITQAKQQRAETGALQALMEAQSPEELRGILGERPWVPEGGGIMGILQGLNPMTPSAGPTGVERSVVRGLLENLLSADDSTLDSELKRARLENMRRPESPFEADMGRAKLDNIRARTDDIRQTLADRDADSGGAVGDVETQLPAGFDLTEEFNIAVDGLPQVVRRTGLINDEIKGKQAYKIGERKFIRTAQKAGVPGKRAQGLFRKLWTEAFDAEAGEDFQKFGDPSGYVTGAPGSAVPAVANAAQEKPATSVDEAVNLLVKGQHGFPDGSSPENLNVDALSAADREKLRKWMERNGY